ncbi:hypothetical protein RAH42_07095 [Pyramidobacter sp. YE332]|uniref:hypothetical protein n=1 Tax=unclassified Pyramidobacter TaxID=2632171 RepID=UPI0009902DB2|nr:MULTISPECIES: hypothetical protein [unclassified Pyramidobacter]OON88554.1 hypothetical protein B0D78_08065 [Pyramidobacter sp. C12-8]WOL38929.1 hypothetical protein RAH42_07095 [Pyramidobacter sp. YE332]
MEARTLKRRGSALAVLLIVVSALAGMLALEYARWRGLQRSVGDSILQAKLDAAARDALERATRWIFQRKPENPRGGYGMMPVSPAAGPEQLEIAVPPDIGRFSTADAEVESRVQWCLFTVSPSLNVNSRVAAYPPAVGGMWPDGEPPLFFRQSYAQLQARQAGRPLFQKGAWRVAVTARPRLPAADALHAVTLERVVLVER